jgi:hypothetical protein
MKPHIENKQEELLKLINPLINFMHENGYNYFLVAGKDEVYSCFKLRKFSFCNSIHNLQILCKKCNTSKLP